MAAKVNKDKLIEKIEKARQKLALEGKTLSSNHIMTVAECVSISEYLLTTYNSVQITHNSNPEVKAGNSVNVSIGLVI